MTQLSYMTNWIEIRCHDEQVKIKNIYIYLKNSTPSFKYLYLSI